MQPTDIGPLELAINYVILLILLCGVRLSSLPCGERAGVRGFRHASHPPPHPVAPPGGAATDLSPLGRGLSAPRFERNLLRRRSCMRGRNADMVEPQVEHGAARLLHPRPEA